VLGIQAESFKARPNLSTSMFDLSGVAKVCSANIDWRARFASKCQQTLFLHIHLCLRCCNFCSGYMECSQTFRPGEFQDPASSSNAQLEAHWRPTGGTLLSERVTAQVIATVVNTLPGLKVDNLLITWPDILLDQCEFKPAKYAYILTPFKGKREVHTHALGTLRIILQYNSKSSRAFPVKEARAGYLQMGHIMEFESLTDQSRRQP